MNQAKRLTINTICNIAVLVVNIALGIFVAPFILHHLGPSTYGIWCIMGSLLAYSQLLSLGLNSAINRWVPLYLVEKSVDGVNRVVSTVLIVYLMGAVILIIGICILAWGFPYWFDVPPELVADSRVALGLVGVGFLFLICLNVYPAVLSGLQRYDRMAISDIVSGVGMVLGVVTVLMNGFGLVALALVAAMSKAVRSVLMMVFAKKLYSGLRIDFSLANWKFLKELLDYSASTLMYSCGGIIADTSAKIIIGAMIGTANVTEYAIPAIIVIFVRQLVAQGSAAIKPAAAHLDASARPDSVREMYFAGTRFALMVLLPILGFSLLYGQNLLNIWIGDEYTQNMALILSILMVSAALRLWHMPGFYVVVGLGKHRLFGIVTLVTSLLSIAGGVVAHQILGLGVVGIAAGYAIPDACAAIFIITPYVCKTIGISIRTEILRCVLPAVRSVIPYAVCVGLLRLYFAPDTPVELFGLIGGLCLVIAFGWWRWGLMPLEKERVLRMIAPRKERG